MAAGRRAARIPAVEPLDIGVIAPLVSACREPRCLTLAGAWMNTGIPARVRHFVNRRNVEFGQIFLADRPTGRERGAVLTLATGRDRTAVAPDEIGRSCHDAFDAD